MVDFIREIGADYFDPDRVCAQIEALHLELAG